MDLDDPIGDDDPTVVATIDRDELASDDSDDSVVNTAYRTAQV
jgi:hypothetical protein